MTGVVAWQILHDERQGSMLRLEENLSAVGIENDDLKQQLRDLNAAHERLKQLAEVRQLQRSPEHFSSRRHQRLLQFEYTVKVPAIIGDIIQQDIYKKQSSFLSISVEASLE